AAAALPAQARDAAAESIGAAQHVAAAMPDPVAAGALVNGATSAFLDGFAIACLVAAGVTLLGAVITALLLPARPAVAAAAKPAVLTVPRVQLTKARYSWTARTAAEPSPTAAATRLVDPERRSPTANKPGRLVSNGSGERPSASHRASRRLGSRDRSVSTNPRSSRATKPDNQSEAGSAPMNENR